jgi:AraC-like DNA-binding protein
MVAKGSAELAKSAIRLDRIGPGLQRRFLPLRSDGADNLPCLIVIGDGSARLETSAGPIELRGPSALWRRQTDDARLIMEAGSAGFTLAIPEETLARAIGDFFVSATLLALFDRSWQAALALEPGALAAVAERFGDIGREVAEPLAGAEMLVVSHVRIVLVSLLRLSGAVGRLGDDSRSPSLLLQRFRQLVEAGFRSRNPVSHYARNIGISADRLHAICARELDRTPKQLIDQRVAREAALGLERTMLSVKQLSYSLGFQDPAHFSNFFRRVAGLSPARYRERFKSADTGSSATASASFADWP